MRLLRMILPLWFMRGGSIRQQRYGLSTGKSYLTYVVYKIGS